MGHVALEPDLKEITGWDYASTERQNSVASLSPSLVRPTALCNTSNKRALGFSADRNLRDDQS